MKPPGHFNFYCIFLPLFVSPIFGTHSNDCTHFGQCSQMCENTKGSIKCSCQDGFEVGKENNRSCVVKDNQWKLLFATVNGIGFIDHESSGVETTHRILTDAGRQVGVTYDARRNHIYWTDVSFNVNGEGIYRASLDNVTNIVVVADTGFRIPDGIAFDWITGNIYFSDADLSHIGVCGNTSNFCSVLIDVVLDKPRGIALDPNTGIMFWTDWGSNPAIMRAGMDGSRPTAIVKSLLKWPNGICVDHGNKRIYWLDADTDKIESSFFDGKDRRTILETQNSHPFGIDILGDRLYWSDWNSVNINSINKFTGESSAAHVYQNVLAYKANGIALFHVANQPIHRLNPCLSKPCSHICAISPYPGYECFCPVGMILGGDRNTCTDTDDTAKLAIAFENKIKLMRFKSIGKDVFESIVIPSIQIINAMVYNPLNHSLILSDSNAKMIYEFSIREKRLDVLIDQNLDSVITLDVDVVGENLYWADQEKKTIEVMSFRTRARVVLVRGITNVSKILVVPQFQSLYIARHENDSANIYKMSLAGNDTHLIRRIGRTEVIALEYDHDLKRVIWAESKNGIMQKMSADGIENSVLLNLNEPLLDAVKFGNQVYWMDKFNGIKTIKIGSSVRLIKTTQFEDRLKYSNLTIKMEIINKNVSSLDDLRNKHECSTNDGKKVGCSHLCLLSANPLKGVCRCPEGMYLNDDRKTCQKASTCSKEQFTCSDGDCISSEEVCDGYSDCSSHDDETNCKEVTCPEKHFRCENNDGCISNRWICDGDNDCVGGEDENICANEGLCQDNEFKCKASDRCIPIAWKCDNEVDCPTGDDSDERGCNSTCPEGFFRCNSSSDCIKQNQVCNVDVDCEDGSDEENCDERKSCSNHEFACNDGICINKLYVCDNVTHCQLGEDEAHCDHESSGHILKTENQSNIPLCTSRTHPAKEGDETKATVIMIVELIVIIILFGVIIALLVKKRSVQRELLVPTFVKHWNKRDPEDGKLECEQSLHEGVLF